MCFIFHKWGKWSEPVESLWERTSSIGGVMIPDTKRIVTKKMQSKVCEKCGKYQERWIEEV